MPDSAAPAVDPLDQLSGRATLALVLDAALALGVGYAGIRAPMSYPVTHALRYPLFVGIAAAVLFSLVNRVLVQWAFRASIGKLLFGCRIVRRSDGGRPGLVHLARAWVCGWGYLTLAAMNWDAITWRYVPVTVDRGSVPRPGGRPAGPATVRRVR